MARHIERPQSELRQPFVPPDAGGTPRYSIVLLFPGHMLTDHLAYGDGLVAFGFIAALAKRGHRLHIIAQQVEIKTVLPATVTIHRIGGATGFGSGGRLRYIMCSRSIVKRLLRGEHIDLVHQLNPVNNGMSAGMIGLSVPVILGTFVAKWPADVRVERDGRGRLRTALREVSRIALLRLQERNAAAFLMTTPAALSRLSRAERFADRVHWLPHGVDIAAFSPQAPSASAQKTILYLASVAVKKGVFTLLDAFELVRAEIPDARLVIAGHGPAFEAMQRAVAASPSAPSIAVLGAVNRTLVPSLMADAALYCLPSFGEPYATTVIEAMACAKPVVVTDSGGIKDMVDDAGGRRVKTGDAGELAAAIIEILQSPELARRMGRHNREVVERTYDWPRVTEKLEAVYRTVIARRQQVTRRPNRGAGAIAARL